MSVLFLAPQPLQEGLTGPARRALKLATVVGEHAPVTLAAPSPSSFPAGPFRTLETGPLADQQLAAAFAAHDVVVVQTLPSPRQLLVALRHARRLVVDLLAPLALEVQEMGSTAEVRWRSREMVTHLAAADLVLCSNERQRDLLLGAGLAMAALGPAAPPLDERLAVVPHGVDERIRERGRSALRTGELAGGELRIAVWAGGLWSWLDPLTAIRAMERLRTSRPDVRLAFVGSEHPDPAQRAAHAATVIRAREEVARLGLEESVVFRPSWMAYDDYMDHLADADVGLSLHGETLEGRFASRTRVVDYLQAGLPVVAARGDTMSELVERHGLGSVVERGDADGCAAAIDALTAPGAPRGVDLGALEPLQWRNVARPLVEFCVAPPPPVRRAPLAGLALVARQYPAFLAATRAQGGLGSAAGRGVRRIVRRSGPRA